MSRRTKNSGRVVAPTPLSMEGHFLPELTSWDFLFQRKYGQENRTLAISEFIDFIDDQHVREYEPQNLFMLGGTIYGKDGYADGYNTVFADNVKSIRKTVDPGTYYAVTYAGDHFYLREDAMSQLFQTMVNDFRSYEALDSRKGIYLPNWYQKFAPEKGRKFQLDLL